jgi:uncharacterized protein YceH (UPF0502 family)
MSKFKTETAYEIDGVYFVDTEFEGRPVTISVRTADTTGTPLSETEIEALKALKAAEQDGTLTRKAMRDLGKTRKQEHDDRAAAEIAAVAAEEANKPKPPRQPNPAELLARIEALAARVAALEAAQVPATPPGKAK